MNDLHTQHPTTPGAPSDGPRRRAARPLGWLIAGVILGAGAAVAIAFFTPVGSRLRPAGSESPASAGATRPEQHQLWTCSMHPQVVEDHPGKCPICGMNLVRLRRHRRHAGMRLTCGRARFPAASGASGDRKVLFYRNPMDPTITSPVPRKDEMGMDYVPVYADESSGRRPDRGAGGVHRPRGAQNMNVPTAGHRRDVSRARSARSATSSTTSRRWSRSPPSTRASSRRST